ncbi:NAD(P)/FAD-dependent oxidoreductase [Candidatus Micrarchaeota archaeon]|nr:NAD(P)/FAD-dependent oxidoreductase [Candidatus Micrarchaeota archaeon]
MIVGASVVGSYLASLTGMDVWERNNGQKEKPCSTLISKRGYDDLLGRGYDDLIANKVKGAVIHAGKEELAVERKENVAFVISRLGLQRRLAEVAESRGASISYGRAWKGEQDEFVVGADGAASGVARSIGVKRDYFYAFQAHASMKQDPSFVHLYFGDYSRGLFAWSIPHSENEVELGLGVNGGNAGDCFRLFCSSIGVRFDETWKRQAALIPVFDASQPTVRGNVALVGDAAAQVKATTGGGIVFGLRCARILADAIRKNDLGSYERGWRNLHERDLRMHGRVRRFIDAADMPRLVGDLRNAEIGKTISLKGDMDHPRSLLASVALKSLVAPRLWKYLPQMMFA